jgi:hypothetical protein
MDSTITNEPVYLVCAEGPPMRLVAEMVERVASSDASVLLLGEPGTALEMSAGGKTVASDLVGLHRTLVEELRRRQLQGVGVRPSSRIRGVLGAGVI